MKINWLRSWLKIVLKGNWIIKGDIAERVGSVKKFEYLADNDN